jgi:restriction system protein
MTVPKYDDLFNVTLEALHKLGGSASIQELEDEVSKILNLSEEDLSRRVQGRSCRACPELLRTSSHP